MIDWSKLSNEELINLARLFGNINEDRDLFFITLEGFVIDIKEILKQRRKEQQND